MIVLLAIASWSLITLLIGLVTGDPFLRTGSAGVLCLSVGAAFLLDRLTPRREEPEEFEGDWLLVEFDEIRWPWRGEDQEAA